MLKNCNHDWLEGERKREREKKKKKKREKEGKGVLKKKELKINM